MTPGTPRRLQAPTGFSLVEMVVSLAVIGLLLGGMTSAVVLATRAMPHHDGPAAATVDAADALHQLRDELAAATALLNRTATGVTINLPDRDGDGRPEVVTYAWAGTPGDPLTRAEDGDTPNAVIEAVEVFDLAYTTADTATVYPGFTSWSSEVLLGSHETAKAGTNFRVKPAEWIGTRLTHAPAGGGNWRVTRLLFFGKDAGSATGQNRFELRNWNDGQNQPGGSVLDQVTVMESSLSDSFAWHEAVFPGGVELAAGDEVAVVVKAATSEDSARLKHSTNDDAPSAMFSTTDSGGVWTHGADGDELVHFLYGETQTVAEDWTFTRSLVTAVDVTLATSAASGTTHRLAVPLANTPEAVDDLWEIDGSADPSTLDLDDDQQADWYHDGVFDDTRLSGGHWEVTDTVRAAPDSVALDVPFSIELWAEDTTDDGNAGGFRVRFDRDGSQHAHVCVAVELEGSQQRVTIETVDASDDPVDWVVQDRPAGAPVRVTIDVDPGRQIAGVRIDGEVVGSFAYDRPYDDNPDTMRPFTDTDNSGVWIDRLRLTTGGSAAETPGAYTDTD